MAPGLQWERIPLDKLPLRISASVDAIGSDIQNAYQYAFFSEFIEGYEGKTMKVELYVRKIPDVPCGNMRASVATRLTFETKPPGLAIMCPPTP
ncbi:hypothetical protein C8R44DRAFT_891205 [Mycena epipterygia]|nr:hypothetical protein C8R44DRAFT_891205 [Mycena epipterygia]